MNQNNKTWADVAFALLEFLNKIFNKGGIYYVIALIGGTYLLILAARLPPDELGQIVPARIIPEFEFAIIIILLLILLAGWKLHCKKVAKMQREIDRLTAERSEHLHGGTILREHVSSSDAENRPAVLLPTSNPGEQND